MTTAPENPAISILLCTRDRTPALRTCVPSILANRFTNYELIVVDQSRDLSTASYLASIDDPRLRPVRAPGRGLARSRNRALLAARAPLVAFTDDDCLCDPDWIGEIVRAFAEFPGVQGVYGRVRPLGDRAEEGLICHCLMDDPEERVVQGVQPPHERLGHGNNMAFRISLFRKEGLFNTGLGAGTWLHSGEDTDFTYRVLHRGHALLYSPKPLVYHDNWKTLAQVGKLDCGYVSGFVTIFGKHALQGDPVARRSLARRWNELKEDLRDGWARKDYLYWRQTWLKIFCFGGGFLTAAWFLLKKNPPWPAKAPD